MKIAVVGTGYVGLVTGVALSDIGHDVTCIDLDSAKVEMMRGGISPIYEPGLEELMRKNHSAGRLHFTSKHQEGFDGADAIYIAVGTPQKEDGTADLRFIEAVAKDIAANITKEAVVVTKSTVPIGTNELVKKIITENTDTPVEVVSNPEFLREGSAVHDTFNGDRIVIGAESEKAASLIEEINKPFGIPVYKTDIRSAEMIKYASNAFLAVKISFVNEIANLCDKLGANVEDVAQGMGQDKRIGSMFLNAGIGYGGSCFPKDTSALVQIADQVGMDFALLREVMNVNTKQQELLVNLAKERFGSLKGKRVAMLGLAFKPNTDDMREAASIVVARELVLAGATVVAYDPIATDNAKPLLPEAVEYVDSPEAALSGSDFALVLTEWDQVKNVELSSYAQLLNEPIVFDGRNCYNLEEAKEAGLEYYSVGRPSVQQQPSLV
ncbi:UDP-glucose/GDP-mannose dehydrogenase family protein [Alkalihalobacillus sp. MEB130]|uniref:UDP-glucose dehydrogenase family protein n=1 Tax=Alkalihalobacillus sp. MEB130 TaxID=2976704 RepID=UPI0028E02A31|nr:UDP-glucose/GDP-mannose dehydrogenase family protein [Alkalihalobacillus sp. MEB130]MDT8860341.1 UDP-glucose/GDP-mannose dehydrogenase family protein [Alkalihalobacillus sp. MEB130]